MVYCTSMPFQKRVARETIVVVVAVFVLALSFLDRMHTQASVSYADRTGQYTDSPTFSQEEAVAISVLTNLGAVQGNPDGTFAPDRRLNRAEFTKIALLSSPGFLVPTETKRCFGDVGREGWFSVYVCYAKDQRIVEGYPDGLFHPERDVNYVEAVKILSEVYKYELEPQQRGDEWYVRYMNAAGTQGVLLEQDLLPSHPLTRGQMARLASAFRAEREGELSEYRARERGEVTDIPNEEAKDTKEPDEEMGDGIVHTGPITSRFLMLGEVSQPVAEGTFLNMREDGILKIVQITLDKKVNSLRSFHLVDEYGTRIAILSVDTNDTQDRLKWEARENGVEKELLIPKGERMKLFLLAELRERGRDGGSPGEVLEVRNWRLTMQSLDAERSFELLQEQKVHPMHQTVQGEIVDVQEVSSTNQTELRDGEARTLGTFFFKGKTYEGTKLYLDELLFTVQPVGLETRNHRLRHADGRSSECFRENAQGTQITCPLLDESMGRIRDEGLVLEFIGDITRLASVNDPTLQVLLDDPGTFGENGAIRWNDGTGKYNWVNTNHPVAEGPLWSVMK